MNLTKLMENYHARSGEQSNNINFFVAKALIFIVENYFFKLAPSFALTLSCRDSHTSNFYNELLEQLFKIWQPPPMQFINIPSNGTLHVPGKRYCNLILVDSFESFRAIDVISYTGDYHINEYYHIFLQCPDHKASKEMALIFDYCWQHQIINCNVQLQTAQGELPIYTYYPYTKNSCGQVTSMLINQFNRSALVQKVLFPKKLKNFYGCSLRVATWNVPPFLKLKVDNNGSGIIFGGIEGHLVKALAEKLNFSVEVKVPPKNQFRGTINGKNLTGALQMLHERTADFSLGSFRLAAERLEVVSNTNSHYHTAQVVYIPRDAYKFSSLEILLFPFTFFTWISLLTMLIIAIAIMVWINKNRRIYPAFIGGSTNRVYSLDIWLITLGMSAMLMPTRTSSRLLFTHSVFFTLLIRTIYQALLFHMIRTQVGQQLPATLDELLAFNFTIAMNPQTYYSLTDIEFMLQVNRVLLKNSSESVQAEFIVANARKNLAAAGPLEFLLQYGNVHKKAGVYYILPQSLVSFAITMYMTKHSFLISQFENEILRMRSMGFIGAWSNWELDYKYLKTQQHLKDNIFGMKELYMIFVIWLGGLGFGAIIFALEILSKRLQVLQEIFLKI